MQGPSGILRRVQVEAETRELATERDQMRAEVDRMQNLTRRLSDEYLDIDLLDERARDVLGVIRTDEVILSSPVPAQRTLRNFRGLHPRNSMRYG